MTDNMDCFTRFTVPSLNLDHYFDAIASSSDYGLLKKENNGAFFKAVAGEHDINLSESFFIDDGKNTCELFEIFGKKSFNTTSLRHTKDILNHLIKT
ncbi:MAG: hypothetical protein JXQ74_03405 [Alphaproteobacteria bacterium]|nr:hypothetical protein [Alphaproteobacteria bacterium]